MAMPGDTMIPLLGTSYWAYELSTSILNGSLPLSRLNDQVTRIVATWYQLGQNTGFPDPNFSSWTNDTIGPYHPGALLSAYGTVNQHVDVQADHANVSRAVATDSITMLKNVNFTLPLAENISIALFGTDQAMNPNGVNSCASRGCDEGTLGMGWGSGTANYPYMDDPLTAIRKVASSVESCNTDTAPLSVSNNSDTTAIVFVNADSGEGSITVEGNPGDRTASGLYVWHDGDTLVEKVAQEHSTVIVVVHSVGPILMENWIDLPSVKAVLLAHLPGQEAGLPITDVIFGNTSPSGHLPYSIPKAESDYPASVGIATTLLGQVQDTFSEGLYIDYRYLNKHSVAPRFPFGYGLSFTSFSFSDASIEALIPINSVQGTPPPRSPKGPTPSYSSNIPPASEVAYPANLTRVDRYLYPYLDDPYSITNSSAYPYPNGYSTTQKPGPAAGGGLGGNDALWDTVFNISVTVTNVGKVAGKVVAQLYLQYPSGIAYDTPIIQLRDFAKTNSLAAGSSQRLTMSLARKDLSVWDVVSQNWIVPETNTPYSIWIGASSGELRTMCSTDGTGCQYNITSPVTTDV